MFAIESKLPQAGVTIFSVMSALAQETGAINLSQGFPDFAMDEQLIELVHEAMQTGYNQYAPTNGYFPLCEVLAHKVQKLYGTNIDPSKEITITPGGTYALFTAIQAVLRPGDEAIVLEPAYDSYVPSIIMAGATPVAIPLDFPGYGIPWDKVAAAITANTRMIIINHPHNPTGTTLSWQDIQALHDLVKGTRIIILSDEVYEHLIYDGAIHHSMLRYPELQMRCFCAYSFGKVLHCTGWKLGYVVAPEGLMREFRKVHQFNVFSCNMPMQVAIAQYLQDERNYIGLASFYQQKRDYFAQLMRNTPFTALPTSGSYFQCYSYAHLNTMPELEFAQYLTRTYGVAVIPVSAFYSTPVNHGVVRFCFAKKEETLLAAAQKLSAFQGIA
jgi:methionine aminotransferase